MAGGDRHHRRRRRYVEIVSRNLLRVIEGASEIVKSSLGLLGVRKSRAFNRAMSILLVSAFTLRCALSTRMRSQ